MMKRCMAGGEKKAGEEEGGEGPVEGRAKRQSSSAKTSR